MHMREHEPRQWRRHRQVVLADAPLAEQRLVAAAAGRVGGEQHQPGGLPVDAVQRHERRVVQSPHQPRQQRLAHVGAGGRHRQEVRLAGHDQVRVGMHHGLGEGDGRLVRHLAEVVDLGTAPVGSLRVERAPVRVQYAPPLEALAPGTRVHAREPCA